MISEKQKTIYNNFLIASRTAQNKPFKLRQNFDKLSDKEKISLLKLENFFNKYRHINFNDFFIAPYKVYPGDNYFDLDFFITRKAIKCYSTYITEREFSNPDGESNIELMKECIRFIFEFCKENKISLHVYKNLINGTTPAVLQHLRDHKINFYTVHGLQCEKTFKQIENSLLNFIVPGFWDTFKQTKNKFLISETLKEKTKKALKIIEEKLLIYETN